MIRSTSIETYKQIKESGLLSERRWQVYDALYQFGPCTVNELFRKWKGVSTITQQNIGPRLGELRDMGVVIEIRERQCNVTGREVIEWDVTDKLPVKFEKPSRHKCKMCDGKGYLEEVQSKLF